ncbi:MAG: sodium-dependent transporter [Candidatus Fervidibacter sp.]|uniref:sodium-dependent transporter n=1 Tax=Candidatus Fervidibacter sp. TaxID=3100871 RepID=UPI00404969F4
MLQTVKCVIIGTKFQKTVSWAKEEVEVAERRQRERWVTRIGLVLAMAGNAIGLGNFLRFPGRAVRNGGGAFMIPYFIAYIFMGIPVMWLEWAQGRFGGRYGHGTTPGMFHRMWSHPISKYLGVLGIFIPTTIAIYYIYVESWSLGFALMVPYKILTKELIVQRGISVEEVLRPFEAFRSSYVVAKSIGFWTIPSVWGYLFFLITFALNIFVLWRGLARGIEALARMAIPILFLFGILLMVRTLTLGRHEGGSPLEGLGFLWNPNFQQAFSLQTAPRVWLEAFGQIFFSLSLGMGAIQCYASYLGPSDDVMLAGLSTTAMNEFAEVVLGGSVSIPAAVTFFGLQQTQQIVEKGVFFLGFTSMPAIFSFLPAGALLSFVWFLLLFFAGFTSSVAMAQPMLAFLQDELGWSRRRAVAIFGVLWFIATHLCIFANDTIDVLDFWSGSFGAPLFALIEIVLMMWIFGADKMWEEMQRGAQLRSPRFFYYSAKYLTPVLLLLVFAGFTLQPLLGIQTGKTIEGVSLKSLPVVMIARLMMVALLCVQIYLISVASKRWEVKAENAS